MTETLGREIAVEGVDPRELYGAQNVYLEQIKALHPALKIVARGQSLKVLGPEAETRRFAARMEGLAAYYLKYGHISPQVIDQCFAGGFGAADAPADKDVIVYGNNGNIVRARTVNQQRLVGLYDKCDLLFYDALNDMIPPAKLQKFLEEGTVQIAPLAYMRGRTLDNAFVILDEAQNTTLAQIKMFLTRMGRNARFIVTGDVTQIDLPRRSDSGLVRAMEILRRVEGIGIVEFDKRDIVRHPLVKHIVEAFDRHAGAGPAESGESDTENTETKNE